MSSQLALDLAETLLRRSSYTQEADAVAEVRQENAEARRLLEEVLPFIGYEVPVEDLRKKVRAFLGEGS